MFLSPHPLAKLLEEEDEAFEQELQSMLFKSSLDATTELPPAFSTCVLVTGDFVLIIVGLKFGLCLGLLLLNI